jgi:hypothetical protein
MERDGPALGPGEDGRLRPPAAEPADEGRHLRRRRFSRHPGWTGLVARRRRTDQSNWDIVIANCVSVAPAAEALTQGSDIDNPPKPRSQPIIATGWRVTEFESWWFRRICAAGVRCGPSYRAVVSGVQQSDTVTMTRPMLR